MRHPEDQHNFIGIFLKDSLDAKFFVREDDVMTKEPGMVVHTTIQKRYTLDDFRRIIATPSHVLASYQLSFINDCVIVTVKLMDTTTEA